MVVRGRALFIADTSVHELPNAEQLADIAQQSAAHARALGHEPRVALLSYSNFGNPWHPAAQRIRDAVQLLDLREPDFEYDGEMQANVALDFSLLRNLYPVSRLPDPPNVLVMPGPHSATLTAKLKQQAAGDPG